MILLVLCLALDSFAQSPRDTLVFAVNTPGSPPYLYFDEATSTYKGIVPDFLDKIINDGHFNVQYVDSNRARNEQFLFTGKADLFLSSKAWLAHPEKLIASEQFQEHRSYLYSLSPFETGFTLEHLERKHICTRRAFIYPVIDKLFVNKFALRIDSSDQGAMLSMLIKGRCDYAILSEFNALSLMSKPENESHPLFRTNSPTNKVPMVFIMRPSLQKQRDIINKYLIDYVKTDQISNSIRRHIGK